MTRAVRVRIAPQPEAPAPGTATAYVVIDVLRAFTTAAHAFHAGATEIWLCRSTEEAFALRARAQGAVLVGEVGGQQIPGFDHGNSPSEVAAADLRDRVVILRSSNGTQGVARAAAIAGAVDAPILLGSLVVAAATARYLRRIASATAGAIDLVPMGWIGEPPRISSAAHAVPMPASHGFEEGAEDHACATYLAALLTDGPCDLAATVQAVEQSPAGRRAMDPAFPWITPADLACATAVDRFDFAMPVTRRDDLLVAHAVRVP